MSDERLVTERVTAVLTQRLGILRELISPAALLADDLGVDSVDAVEFALALEREFNVRLPDEVIADVESVQDVIDLVHRQVADPIEANRS